MIKQDNALKPLTQRQLPAFRSPEGNFRWSAFKCDFGTLSGGSAAQVFFDNTGGLKIPVLLFTNDYPAIVKAVSKHQNIYLPDDAGPPPNLTRLSIQTIDEPNIRMEGNVNNDYWPLLWTPDVAAVDAGSIASGQTFTNNIRVHGFPLYLELTVTDWLQQDQVTPVSPSVSMRIVANSEITDGPIQSYDGSDTAPLGPGGGDFPTRASVILEESAFTQQMWDDGYLVDNNGTIVDICGIFHRPVEVP